MLPNRDDFTPQPWVPRDIATYTTLYFDILNGFDNFGPLFDELVASGETGELGKSRWTASRAIPRGR